MASRNPKGFGIALFCVAVVVNYPGLKAEA